jgi:hypothetical protein
MTAWTYARLRIRRQRSWPAELGPSAQRSLLGSDVGDISDIGNLRTPF